MAFLIFVRCNIKWEAQTTWFSTSVLLTPLAFRLIIHRYEFQNHVGDPF